MGFLTEMPAVIAPKDDLGLVRVRTVLKRAQNLADHRVGEGN